MDAGYLRYIEDGDALRGSLLQNRQEFLAWLGAGRDEAVRSDDHAAVVRARQAMRKQSCGLHPTNVRFTDLNVQVPLVDCGTYGFTRSLIKPLKGLTKRQEKRMYSLLRGITGQAEIGEMVLVLAPPGSGVTSLLKVLAGQREKGMEVSGRLTYNGTPHTGHVLKTCYAGEEDDHLPSLTVEKTFRVACELSTETDIPDRANTVEGRIEAMLKALNLNKARDTKVGSTLVRGVSGGEKKRVSVGEALLMQGELTVLDGWSRGLDSATALRIGQLLRALTNISGTPCISALYQASPALYSLYDKVLLLRDGGQVFFGTPQDAMQYTAEMSITRPLTQTVPDFLSSLPHTKGSLVKAWACSARLAVLQAEMDSLEHYTPPAVQEEEEVVRILDESLLDEHLLEGHHAVNYSEGQEVVVSSEAMGVPGAAPVPCVAGERFNHFLLFSHVVQDQATTALYVPDSALSHEKERPSQKRALIATGALHSLWWLCWREYHLTKADVKQYIVARTGRYLFIGFLLGLLYFRLPMDLFGAYNREGLLAITTNIVGTGSFVLIPGMLDQREVFYRHKRSYLYRPYAWPVAKSLFDIPVNFLEAFMFVMVFYFMTDLNVAPVSKFFTCLLLFFFFDVTTCNFTRLFALLSKDLPASQGIAGTGVIVFSFFNGFAIPYDQIPVWWKWAYLVSPFSYMYEAIMLNEFGGVHIHCSNVHNPAFQEQCERVTGGLFIKETVGITDDEGHKWFCLAMIFVFNVAAIVLSGFVATKIAFTGKVSVTFKPDEDDVVDGSTAHFLDVSAQTRLNNSVISLTEMSDLQEGTLLWNDVSYAIPEKVPLIKRLASSITRTPVETPPPKVLLQNVNGYCKPGSLMALMGSTGAGKTTLLDVLAKRKTVGSQRGAILLDGVVMDRRTIRDKTGYVEQNDLHHPRTTVREAVRFSAQLRGGTIEAADEMIRILGLEAEADAMVGGSKELATTGSVSLVTMKKLTIAVELVSNPILLFLDEPTSGLDSEGALNVMKAIRSIAETGRSVVCTIHQPSPEVFQLFDSILLLHAGQMVYSGPTGQVVGEDNDSAVVLNYFKRNLQEALEEVVVDSERYCQVYQKITEIDEALAGRLNPADVIMSIVNSGQAARQKDSAQSVSCVDLLDDLNDDSNALDASVSLLPSAPTELLDWTNKWTSCDEAAHIAEEIEALSVMMHKKLEADAGKKRAPPKNTLSSFAVLRIVYARARTIFHRSPTYVFAKLMFTLLISILFGTTYWQLGTTNQDMRNYATLVYVSGNMGIVSALSSLPPVLEGRPSFYREVTSGTYPAWTNAVSGVLSELPLIVVTSTIWINILFWGAGFPVSAYGYFALQYLGLSLFMQMFGMAVAAAVPTLFLAQLLLPLLNMLWILHSGFVILTRSIPVYLLIFHYANPLTYFLRSMVANVIHHNTEFSKIVDEFVDPTGETCRLGFGGCSLTTNDECLCATPLVDPTQIACDKVPDVCTLNATNDCVCEDFSRGDIMLSFYGWSYDTIWQDFGALWGVALVLTLLYMLAIIFVRHIKR